MLLAARRGPAHFRPGRGCYRPLRGTINPISGNGGCGAAISGLHRRGTLPPPLGMLNQALPVTLSAGQGQPLGFGGSAFLSLVRSWTGLTCAGSRPDSLTCIWGYKARAVLFLHWGWG